MENASKALIIAGGVLLAVIIMSLIASFFAGVSQWPQQQDDTESKEQLAKFNQEYEVYEKSAMYGTDVISCLNKVVNFDEKYVEEDEDNTQDGGDYKGGWLSGTKYGEKKEFAIDVCVKLKELKGTYDNDERGYLEESLEVYYINSGNGEASGGSNKEQIKTNDGDTVKIGDIISLLSKSQDSIKKERSAYLSKIFGKTDERTYRVGDIGNAEDGYYELSLLKDDKIDTNGELYRLINLSKFDLKVTIKNPDSSSLRKWSTVVWKTALYDFKSRKFRCDGIDYNPQTGRVNKISFSEI